jgi:hypothetical protein
MITIDCPLCAGEATTDETLSDMTCAGCGVTVDIAPDLATSLDVAA